MDELIAGSVNFTLTQLFQTTVGQAGVPEGIGQRIKASGGMCL